MNYDVNFIVILVAGVVGGVLRVAWYLPPVFGDLLNKELGLAPAVAERVRRGAPVVALIGLIACVIAAYVIAHVAEAFSATGLIEGFQVGFSLWLGFIATSFALSTFQEARSFSYYAIHAGYYLVALVAMSVIIVLWP